MTWRDELRRVSFGGKLLIGASFRGIPFFVDSSERAGGRRLVAHEFPLRDDPFVEDLGRKARSFRVEGYVIGDDYLAQRDSLLSALEDESGPGELVHPYHGAFRASCVNVTVRESRAEGGMATFSIEFAEAPAQGIAPVAAVDTSSRIAVSSAFAAAAVKAEFTATYSSAGMPSFALASAEDALRRAGARLASTLSPLVSATQALADLTSMLTLLGAQASSLVRAPASLVSDMVAALAVAAAAVEPRALAVALLEAYDAATTIAPPETTGTRKREAANLRALTSVLQRVMLVSAARAAAAALFPTLDEATATRDRVAALLEQQEATAGDEAYPALVQLRTDLVRALPGDSVRARVVTISRIQTLPSLVLAYQLHGRVAQEQDIIDRNRVPHPGFVAGTLKVLSNA